MFNRLKIRPLFVFSFILIVLFILVITVNIQYYFSNKIVEDSLEKYIKVLSTNISSEVEDMERRTQNVVRMIEEASNDLSQPFAAGEFHPIIKKIGLTIENNSHIYAGYLGYPDGRFLELINLQSHPDLKEIYKTQPNERWLVVKILKENGVAMRYDEFLDKDYNYLRSVAYETGYDPSLRPWYIDAKGAARIIKTQPYQYSLFDTTGVTFAKEVPSQGLTIGFDISARTLEEYLDENTAIEGSKIILLSRDNRVIATTKNVAGLNLDNYLVKINPEQEVVKLNGEKYVYEHIELASSLDFVNKISLLIPRKELFKSFNTILSTQVASNLLFIILMLVITWLYARYNAKLRADKVTELLNNSGEGFLSFTSDLIVDSQFSQACKKMLGTNPAGKNFVDLLFAEEAEKSALVKQVIPAVILQEDNFIKESMLSLLPNYTQVGGYKLAIKYRYLGDDKFMVILTDISEQEEISKQLDSERKNLKMIVQAITDSHSFFQAIDGFKEFTSYYQDASLASDKLKEIIKSLYREVHTYKGLLAQYSFMQTPELLHEIETELNYLSNKENLDLQDLVACLQLDRLKEVFNKELKIIADVLGDEFLSKGRKFVFSEEQAYQMQELAQEVLAAKKIADLDRIKSSAMVQDIACLTRISLIDSLRSYENLLKQTVLRLEKSIQPINFVGSDVWVDPKKYQGFIKSLVHLFRNAVIHGIESPDERLAKGKLAAGQIICELAVNLDTLELTISDDGAGIDLEKIYKKAQEQLDDLPQDLSPVQIANLIFLDQVSTAETTTDLAGRGVGLAALMQETESLGGRIEVITELDKGTRFIFFLPIEDQIGCI